MDCPSPPGPLPLGEGDVRLRRTKAPPPNPLLRSRRGNCVDSTTASEANCQLLTANSPT